MIAIEQQTNHMQKSFMSSNNGKSFDGMIHCLRMKESTTLTVALRENPRDEAQGET
jgi:hypothetical protein